MPHPSHLHILNIQADEKYTSKYIFFKRNNNFLLSKFAMINRYQPRTTRSYLNKQQLASSYENSLSSLLPSKRALFVHVPRFSFRYIFVRIGGQFTRGMRKRRRRRRRLRILSRCTRPPRDRDTDSRIFPPPGIHTGNLSVCGG